jgi:hypothetical protein
MEFHKNDPRSLRIGHLAIDGCGRRVESGDTGPEEFLTKSSNTSMICGSMSESQIFGNFQIFGDFHGENLSNLV